MKNFGGIAALVVAILLLCGVVAWEWYSHVAKRGTPEAVRQITAATQPPSSSPSPSPTPVTYVLQTQPSPAPSASASAPSRAAPGVAAAASPAPTPEPFKAAAGVQVTQAPMIAATIAPHVVAVRPMIEPADAPPRILAMSISTPVVHSGDVVSGTVETSSNVASVEARIAGYSSSLQKIGVGKFAMTYRVPNLPFFLRRTYTIEVIARNTRGDAVRSAVPITVR